jgi:nucleoside-diphosphate-sugar epimerase
LLITTGTPDKRLPLIYVDDLVNALISIAANNQAVGKIYNIAHPEMPTTAEFLKTYREVSGDRRPTIDIPLPRLLPVFRLLDGVSKAMGRRSNYAFTAARLACAPAFSADKLNHELGYAMAVGYHEGLSRLRAS